MRHPKSPIRHSPATPATPQERPAGAPPHTAAELNELAAARAAAITGFFLESSTIPAERIATGPVGPVKKKDAGGNWVRLRLVLSAP